MSMARRLGKWYSLGVPPQELHLDFVIPTGQSFRWRKSKDGVYSGVIGSRVVELKHTVDGAHYRTIYRAPKLRAKDDEPIVKDYFNLDIPVVPLYEAWSASDTRFKALQPYFPGARVLRQDPFECLVQFICSSNNNIARIQGMVDRLCARYGDLLLENSKSSDITPSHGRKVESNSQKKQLGDRQEAFYKFPTLKQLSAATEEELLGLGFGYRAKYITGSVAALLMKPSGGERWLLSLRQSAYSQASTELCTLPGVGPKVAACVCLFSLDKHEAVPVDTHVWQIATRHYTQELEGQSLTTKLMEKVEAVFVDKFGDYAGWTLNVLFIPELPVYAKLLPEELKPLPRQRRAKKRKAQKGLDVQDE